MQFLKKNLNLKKSKKKKISEEPERIYNRRAEKFIKKI